MKQPKLFMRSHFFIQPNCQPNVNELYKWNSLNSLLGSYFLEWPNYDPNVSELHNEQFTSHSVLESHFFNGPIFTQMLPNCAMKVHFTFLTRISLFWITQFLFCHGGKVNLFTWSKSTGIKFLVYLKGMLPRGIFPLPMASHFEKLNACSCRHFICSRDTQWVCGTFQK